MWRHPTHFQLRLTMRFAAVLTFVIALITTLVLPLTTFADEGINTTLSVQGRLLRSNGGVVPDGRYNLQFKIYEGGTGTEAGNPNGTLRWTETYVNNGNNEGVQVRNGVMSVNLGSRSAFGDSIDWNQDTLWLSMNVAGSAADCTTFNTGTCLADGEMLPMKRLTSSPYAMNSGAVGGKRADQLTQLGQGVQTDASDMSSIFINKTGTGNLLQLQHTAQDVFAIGQTGNVMLGNNEDKSITIADSDELSTGKNLSLAAGGGGSGGGNVTISGGSGSSGDSNGGNITLSGGSGNGAGANGLVILGTPTFSTVTDDANCYTSGAPVATSCNVAGSTINTSSGVLVGFNTAEQTATLPDPTTDTAGRIFYVMAAGDSEEFSLVFNSDAATKSVRMEPNTTVSLIWNGQDWTETSIGQTATRDFDDGNDSSASPIKLDRADTTPVVEDETAALGSMYYDTTLGKVQCYEDDGWGACGAAPDTFITLSPEYSNAVMNGTDIGTISSDLCSDELNLNDGSASQPEICGTDETQNYYNWTSDETSAQTRSIYITHKLPSNFKEFVEESTSLMARTDHADANVSYQVYRDSEVSGLISCGSGVTVSTGAQTSWQNVTAVDAADPATCGFEAGDSLLIRINLSAQSNANAYVSDLSFVYRNN